MKRNLKALAALAAVMAGLVVIGELMPSRQPPTIESMRAACASAPDPDGCFSQAVARTMGPEIDAAQRAAEDKASGQ